MQLIGVRGCSNVGLASMQVSEWAIRQYTMTSWIIGLSSPPGSRPARRASARRPQRASRCIGAAAGLLGGLALLAFPAAADEQPDTRPLSTAQIALFETPHLHNVDHPEALLYRFERAGAGAFTDSIDERIEKIHDDGTKYVGFNFLNGEHHEFFPAVDNFRGNPLLMLFLEHDVREMRDQTGIAATYYRNRIREAFIDRAEVADVQFTLDGKPVPARRITLQPFTDDQRLDRMPEIKRKTYTFVLADQVPGTIAELAAEEPADTNAGTAGLREQITFVRAEPLKDQP
jgi:hypothetical protein